MQFPINYRLTTLFLISCLGIIGCNERSFVDAVPRQSSNQPTLHKEKLAATDSSVKPPMVHGSDVSFLNQNHFGCFWVNADAILDNLSAFQVNPDNIANELARMIGPSNAKLDNIEKVWLILDREFLTLIPDMSGQRATLPSIFILDFKSPIDVTQLDKAIQRRLAVTQENLETDEKKTAPPELAIKALTDHRLAMGAPEALANLSNNGTGALNLIRDLQQLPSDSEMTGAIIIQPIRPTLQGVFDLLRNTPLDIKKFADLPSDLQKLTLNLDLNNQDDFFELGFFIDNPSLKSELFQIANTAISSTGGGVPAGLPGVPMAGGLPINNTANGQLIAPESADVLMQVAEQIQQGNLLKVQDETDKLLIKMARPDSLPELIQAAINDSQRQFQLAARTGHFKKIAAALEQYEEQYGALPAIHAHPKTDDLPGQLSWRVAILPMLGYQELYDRFDFDLPWNHADNLAVAIDIPEEFQSVYPSDPPHSTPHSNIHLYAGEEGLHADRKASPKMEAIKDRKIWTAIAIEGPGRTAQPWTEPNAIDGPATSLSEFGNENENAILMIDASFNVRAVRRNLDKIQAVLSIEGGEKMKRTDFIKID